MLIDHTVILDALNEAIGWQLRPALDSDRLFDDLGSRLHKLFPSLKITEIDLLLGDLKRQHVHNMQQIEWELYDAFCCTLGVRDGVV
jgi:hypothetical protein